MSASFQYVSNTIKTAGSVVHLEYDPQCLPASPGPEWTRFVCISDTHSRQFHVPDGDVLLHSGDLTNLGLEEEFKDALEWLYSLPHKIKIIIAGNHDLPLHEGWYDGAYRRWHKQVGKQDRAKIMEFLTGPRAKEAGIVYLQGSTYSFQAKTEGRTWNVYALVSKIPVTDILLTHGPPARILDLTRSKDFAGCVDLRNNLSRLRPRLHLFGHIHEARGAHVHNWDDPLPEVNIFEGSDSDSDLGSEDSTNTPQVDSGTTMQLPSEDAGETAGPIFIHEADVGQLAGDGAEQTVFVNASTFPAGRGEWRAGQRVPFGGPGFQPVIVDLRD
ncbi:hypothetical protein DXG01_002087 [Tephrocybe rancida]|nr:hypothetical protein DXG01_002087 [Tephrocybe rancida]